MCYSATITTQSGILEGQEPHLPSAVWIVPFLEVLLASSSKPLHGSTQSTSPITISQRLGTNFIVRAVTFIGFELGWVFAKGCRERFYSLPSIRVQF